MLFITVVQRIGAYDKSQCNHDDFEGGIFNNIDTENVKTRKKQGQKSAVYSTSQRSGNT